MNKENIANINRKENPKSSTDFHVTIDPYRSPKLTESQKAELDVLSNLSDDAVRKEVKSDPDCEPLE